MNITELGQGSNAGMAPRWPVALGISIGGMVLSWPLLWLAVKLWRKYYRQPKQNRRWRAKLAQDAV